MKQETIIQYTTLGANVGVIIGIALLAFELNQNNQLLEAQANTTHMMWRVNVNERWADDAELMSLRLKSSQHEQLTPLEEARLKYDAQSVIAYWVWQVENYDRGALNFNLAGSYKLIMAEYPYFRKTWQENKTNYPSEFTAFIETNVISQLD